jgi:uncharacterized Zn finger protein (UPF0148 family)
VYSTPACGLVSPRSLVSTERLRARAARSETTDHDDVFGVEFMRRGMKIRGERECKACGCRFSYYETGEVTCPDCGSLRSVGVDERNEHTASPETLDLTSARSLVDEEPIDVVARAAADECREFTRSQGFIKAGSLLELDGQFVAALELAETAAQVKRALRVTDDEERYFYELLRGADHGERPSPADVPSSMRTPRGLAAAAAAERYCSDLRRSVSEESVDDGVARRIEALGEHQKRIQALDGAVAPATAEALIAATRELGRASIGEGALETVDDQLDSLSDFDGQ